MSPYMSTCIVPVIWDPSRRVLYSPRKPPVQLHVCVESRHEALKLYQLHFATSPEFARTYFSHENDILLFNWASLGPAPGRLGRKIGEEEVKHIKTLMINEEALLLHAREGMRELDHFAGLRDLAVLCDSENVQSGECFGAYEIEAFAEGLDYDSEEENGGGEVVEEVKRKHRWPELVCLRDEPGAERCSRHWWFDGWNQRAQVYQKEKWTNAMSECLLMTNEDYGDEGQDEDALMDFLHFVVDGHGLP